MKRRKQITMLLTVSVPKEMTASMARKQVRSLVNDQCEYWDSLPVDRPPYYVEIAMKVAKIKAVK